MSTLMVLGRRVERLLYLGLVLMVATYAGAFVAQATKNIERDALVHAISDFIEQLDSRKAELTEQFASDQKARKIKYEYAKAYSDALDRLFSDRYLLKFSFYYGTGTHNTIREDFRKLLDASLPPDDLIAKLRNVLEARTKGARLLGVDVPRLIKLQLGGGEYQLPIELLSRSLTVLLAPLLVLWIGSVYVTRYREILLIVQASSINATFPHVLNVLPVLPNLPTRKGQNRRLQRWAAVFSRMLIRLLLTILFLLSLLGPYFYSVWSLFVNLDDFDLWTICFVIALCVLLLQSFMLLALEIILALTKKNFIVEVEGWRI